MKDKGLDALDLLIERANQAIEAAEEWKSTEELVKQSQDNPGMELKFSDCDDCEEEAAPLTTKQRKALKSSTFCGPNRSFPVPDCKHVGTAKAYLNRSNFSKSTKQKIAACINRKAKQLGCTPGKPAKAK